MTLFAPTLFTLPERQLSLIPGSRIYTNPSVLSSNNPNPQELITNLHPTLDGPTMPRLATCPSTLDRTCCSLQGGPYQQDRGWPSVPPAHVEVSP